jgi:predicted nucleic acid-binding protein
MFVVDANVVVAALTDNGRRGGRARELLSAAVCCAPELLDLEVLDSLRRLLSREVVPLARAAAAAAGFPALPVERVPHARLLPRCWELRSTVRTYDAAYVALAEARGIPLLTADARLAGAPGLRCHVELVED